MSYCCKGCQKRKAGCKSGCLEYTVERVLAQPEKEEEEKRKEKAMLLNADLKYRTRHFRPLGTDAITPYKNKKK